ncbi:Crp/Fnr family transcriptional regulator [Streptomyces sp. NPDC050529]|uniref:Crp/Fnr family transcriptional regulator n=1 Tax=unclassified Streptomyces TaxID=2593676 RepID=UPI002DDA6E8A|nr:helix-turn-helix domain-containing protein [Streptomyces sp. NBC_01022]WRZ87443.1 helix-turn-helix domain-containing protein [Streptomyces sp. NBC_01022]
MAASERYDEGRPRRNSVRVRLTRYFQSKGVGVEAAAALAAGSTLHGHSREELPIERNFVEIVVAGVVAEDGRLWGSERWLGDLDVFSGGQTFVRPWVEFLCTTWTIRISRDVLRSWALRDLSVQRMLNQALHFQLHVHNLVYGLDSRPAAARLAQLIHYLAHQASALEDARLLPIGEDQLHGPTQKHLADALGVSLASIEKSMRYLRKTGVLASTGGGRANRAYTILDRDHLYAVANGAVAKAA